MHTLSVILLSLTVQDAPLPVIVVDHDNVEITESCTVEIGADVIVDDDGNGVIHIVADDIVVEFSDEKRELIGAAEGTPWDTLTGIGIRIDGHTNVTLRNAHSHRYKVGIYASNADGLVLQSCDVAGGYAQRLRSTPEAEDTADWIRPHENDENEWLHKYGAGIYVEDSNRVTIADCFARRRQNGIVLDRVESSRVYDNDCSFLSGWGLAMWRSSHNFITRNAFDFCIRGYSHGVYNRGQDSAGILVFEQCTDNVFAENSATHCGDGFFAFAGREAIGELWVESERARLRSEVGVEDVDHLITYSQEVLRAFYRRGNNRNLIINNDFSYAAAHGLELLFSFDNQIIGNRLAGNAICGVWGGYSSDTLIAGNEFIANGEAGYGLERGGINIEHGSGNLILDNGFRGNTCGIHLWWDPDDFLLNLPWSTAQDQARLPRNADGSVSFGSRPDGGSRMVPAANNIMIGNMFDRDDLGIHLRQCDLSFIANNAFQELGEDMKVEDSPIDSGLHTVPWRIPAHPVLGDKRPVGARAELNGRDKIVMTEWFPRDWRDAAND